MQKAPLASALEECLEALRAGALPEDLARNYPLLQTDLLALLEIGAALRDPPEVPSPSAFLSELGTRIRRA